MSAHICFYFQVHQPFRLKKNFSFFSIGSSPFDYEDTKTNNEIVQKVAKNCYLPTNELLLKLINESKGQFKVSFSISGVALEQFELYAPEVITSFKKLIQTGCVEILSETYYHSLAFLKSKSEFIEQIKLHKKKIQELFNVTPTTFRNTELIYNNDIALTAEELGYQTILAEGADKILGWRTPNFLYRPANTNAIKLLLKNYELSDDIAFRFSNKNWAEYPLTPEKYINWLQNKTRMKKGEILNLFMDYETFGEHQKADTGILGFLQDLIKKILEKNLFSFITPSEAATKLQVQDTIDVNHYVSWADAERDLSAWTGNSMQDCALNYAYSFEKMVKDLNDENILHLWRKLTISDHYYYLCTKRNNDGDVHHYFNPYGSPHDAFIIYTNVLNDFKMALETRQNPNEVSL